MRWNWIHRIATRWALAAWCGLCLRLGLGRDRGNHPTLHQPAGLTLVGEMLLDDLGVNSKRGVVVEAWGQGICGVRTVHRIAFGKSGDGGSAEACSQGQGENGGLHDGLSCHGKAPMWRYPMCSVLRWKRIHRVVARWGLAVSLGLSLSLGRERGSDTALLLPAGFALVGKMLLEDLRMLAERGRVVEALGQGSGGIHTLGVVAAIGKSGDGGGAEAQGHSKGKNCGLHHGLSLWGVVVSHICFWRFA